MNFTKPTDQQFDLKFTNSSAVPHEFDADSKDLGSEFMISLRDLVDDRNTYQYSLQVHGPHGLTLPVDPAITNHGR